MNRTEFEKAAGEYIASLRTVKSEKTISAYAKVLADFDEHLRRENAEQIEKITVEQYRNAVIDRGASVNTARQYIIDLSAFFGWCCRMKKTDENIIGVEDIPEAEQRRYNLLTDDEINKLMSNTDRGSCKARAIVTLLLQSCLRNEELRSLRLCDLDFENGVITVEKGKGNKSRCVPFPEQSQAAVTEYLNSGNRPKDLPATAPLFGAEYRGAEWAAMTSQAINGLVKRYTRKVCGHEVHTHTLRHAGASKLDDMGVPMRDIQKILGHASIEMTEQTYVTILNSDKAAKSVKTVWDGFSA